VVEVAQPDRVILFGSAARADQGRASVEATGFPRTHTLVEFMTLVEDVGIVVPTGVREAGRLRTS